MTTVPVLSPHPVISITLNGECHRIPPQTHVLALLQQLKIDPARVAVEMNNSIVRKRDWETTEVPMDARIEVVEFVGGG